MAMSLSACKGCLLGLAAGDALGLSVDRLSLAEIRANYGPDGILGYDLRNGAAVVSSHTQLAAYACNGLLLALTRGTARNGAVPYSGYLAHALREWARMQQPSAGKPACWISHMPEFRARRCLDAHTCQALYSGQLGSMSKPSNTDNGSGALAAAVAVGLFFDASRLQPHALGILGAQAVAIAHGAPEAFLCGAFLSYTIAGIVQDRDIPIWQQFLFSAQAVSDQFSHRFPEAEALRQQVERIVSAAQRGSGNIPGEMERLTCGSALQVLLGSVYACVVSGGDFEQALTIAVNHSGRSSAVGALTGAVLGAHLGEEALPEFYTESLTAGVVLGQLAEDLCHAGIRNTASRLFDDDWDCKYIQGEPVSH